MATAPTLDDQLLSLEGDGVRAVILDLRDLSFIDSSGLRSIFAARGRATDNGHRLGIVGAAERTRELFKLSGTEKILDGPWRCSS